MWQDEVTLLDIVEAGRRMDAFVEGVDEAAFIANPEKRWAVVSQLLMIGEAVTQLSKDFLSSHPEILWSKVAGMHNRLIHGYDKIRWELVWRTAAEAVPQLLSQMEPFLPRGEVSFVSLGLYLLPDETPMPTPG